MNQEFAWAALGVLVVLAAAIIIEFAMASGLRRTLGTNKAAWWTRRRT